MNYNASDNRKQKTKEQDSFFAPGSDKVFLGDARSKN